MAMIALFSADDQLILYKVSFQPNEQPKDTAAYR